MLFFILLLHIADMYIFGYLIFFIISRIFFYIFSNGLFLMSKKGTPIFLLYSFVISQTTKFSFFLVLQRTTLGFYICR